MALPYGDRSFVSCYPQHTPESRPPRTGVNLPQAFRFMLVFKYGQNTSHPGEAAVIPGGSAQPNDDDAASQRGHPVMRGKGQPRSQAPAQALARRLNKTIVLVGLMGAGKSCVGKRLAACLGLPFVDADREIEAA